MSANKIVALLNKAFGRTVCRIGSDPDLNIRRMSTGILGLDIALGGGLPRGRYTHFWGGESSGKSTIILRAVREIQMADPKAQVVWVDVEGTYDPVWARNVGVDMARFLLIVPANGEEACSAVEEVVASNYADLVVVDSLGAMAAKAEIEGSMGDAHYALLPRLLSQFFRKTTCAMQLGSDKTNTVCRAAVVLMNQIRTKIGVYGDPDSFPGGWALKHFNSISLRVRRGQDIHGIPNSGMLVDDGKEKRGVPKTVTEDTKTVPVIGHVVQFKPDKNKTAFKTPTMRTALFVTDCKTHAAGEFDHMRDILRLGVMFRVIGKSGGWYTYGTSRFQGSAGLQKLVDTDRSVYSALYSQILKEAVGHDKFSEVKTALFATGLQKAGGADRKVYWRALSPR